MGTQIISNMYMNMSNVKFYKIDIREIELKDSRSNANTKICFEVRATAPHPFLHIEIFSLCPHRTSTKKTPPRNYKSTSGVHNSSLNTNLYTRGGH